VKYGPIASVQLYDFLWENKEEIKKLDTDVISAMIKKCCEIKAAVVSEDEKEAGLREILNFGHTIGHAVESVMDFKYLHGQCVAIGMSAVMEMCVKRGYISEQCAEIFRALLKEFGLELTVKGVEAQSIYKQMFNDKKVKDNKISFVLISRFGETYRTTDVTEEEILDGINYILGE
ncbi:MAG: 3-dehydroquinate synthase, partial [Firmicutes bacterium]|nr:3-dehydroquinate synthase [Bacillota bacterium]